MEKLELARQLTDEVLARQDNLNTATGNVRGWAEVMLTDWQRTETIVTLPVTKEITGTDGALTAIDNLLKVLKKAYANRGPHTTDRYGAIEFRVWYPDTDLLTKIKQSRDEILRDAKHDDAFEEN